LANQTKSTIFALTESATLPVDQRTRAGLLFYDDITNRQIDPNKLYAVLCCIVYWLDAMNRGDEFRSRFSQLLSDYPSVDTAAMGFLRNGKMNPYGKAIPTMPRPQRGSVDN